MPLKAVLVYKMWEDETLSHSFVRMFLIPPEHFCSDTSNTGCYLFKEAVVSVKTVLLMAQQQFCVPLRRAIEAFYFVIAKNYICGR